MKIKEIYCLIFLFFVVLTCYGQTTIWSEDFDSYANGVLTGTGTGASPTNWSSQTGAAILGGLISATDTDSNGSSGANPLIWATNVIDISSYVNISFSVDVNAFDTLELENSDNFSIEYRIDAGSWNIVFSDSGSTSEPINSSYTVNSLSGSTLEIRATFHNTFTNETYTIDNILVQGDFVASNEPPVITATGNQLYCPGSNLPVVETISITDMDDTTLNEVSVQISSGYINGEDLLTLTGSHPTITATWSAVEGKLTLAGPSTLTAFGAAVAAVEYSSSATNPSGTRDFSITIGDPNFLPSTGHYYEFIPDVGITWTDARDAAALRTYYGLQGYLVTLTSEAEAIFSGEQAVGVGWIGASDATTEGDWQWVTGPEAGTSFWSGGVGGTELIYAYWNGGEPNNCCGGEHYAHITDPSVVRGTGGPGSWNDLPLAGGSGTYAPQGYVVEYGGTPGDPIIDVSASTSITIDNINPTASNINPLTVFCTTDIPSPDITLVNDEADNCTVNPIVTFVSDVSDGGRNPEVITRTYRVSDDAGNTVDITQTITVNHVDITSQTGNLTISVGNNAIFSVFTSNANTYQWQFSTDGGTSFNNLVEGVEYSGTQTQTMTVIAAGIEKNNYRYRVIVSNSTTGCAAIISNEVILTLNRDLDGDLILDVDDFDDDNDGILDTQELCRTNPATTNTSIEVIILTDNFPGETTWTLNAPSGQIANGGPYANQGTTYTAVINTIETGTFTFTINDSFGDGICCAYGTGSYSVILDGATTVASGGSFTDDEITNFDIEISSFSCLTSDPNGDDDADNILNFKDIDYAIANSSTLNSNGVVTLLDFDGDGIINSMDLDADNDGVYDAVEAGHNESHTNGLVDGAVGLDGVPDVVQISGQEDSGTVNYTLLDSDTDGNDDYIEIDSDNDGCNDVVEAGFTESGSASGELQGTGYNSVIGLVTGNIDGYTAPLDSDTNFTYDYREVGMAPSITTEPINAIICPRCNGAFEVTASNTDTYQWQQFNGTIWVNLNDTGIYSGTVTNILSITNPTVSENGNQYRVITTSNTYACIQDISNTVVLTIRVANVITNRRITYRVKKN